MRFHVVLSLFLITVGLLPLKMDATPGEVLWQYANTNTMPGSADLTPSIAQDGTLFFPNGRFLDALTPSGSLKWQVSLPLNENVEYGPAIHSPTIRRDGVVLMWTGERWSTDEPFQDLRAVNPGDGTILWSQPWVPLRVAEGLNGTFLLDNSDSSSTHFLLRSIDRQGNSLWAVRIETDFNVRTPNLAIGPEGHLYVLGKDLTAYTQAGERLWSVTNRVPMMFSGISDDGTVYLGGFSLNSNGQFRTGLPAGATSILPSGNVVSFWVKPDSQPTCCEVASSTPEGTMLWTYPGDQGIAPVLPVASDGSVYFVDRYLPASATALGPNGTLAWKVTISTNLTTDGTPTLGPDGTLYIGVRIPTNVSPTQVSYRSSLYAYAGAAPLSLKNWPLPGHDSANSYSDEKPFVVMAVEPDVSRTSVVLRASIRTLVSSVNAMLQLGERPEALSTVQVQQIPGPGEAQLGQFVLTSLQPTEKYYYRLILSNRTTAVESPINSFETPGANENIELAQEALRFALLGGGRITFRTNGIITVTNTIPIRKDSFIDASESSVTIDGQGISSLFSISGANITISGLQLINARNVGARGVPASLSHTATNAGPGLGGAICASNATLRLQNCVFSNCVAQGGAGTTNYFSVAPELDGNPAAGYGGALFAGTSDLAVLNCVFERCAAAGGTNSRTYLADPADGGGAIFAQDSQLQASNCVFRGNSAPSHGSRLSTTEGLGGALLLSNTVAVIHQSSFSTNSSGSGGAIFTDSALTLESSAFDRNTALGSGSYRGGTSSFGGAVCVASANELAASNCTFTRNLVQAGWGGSPGGFVPAGLGEGGAIYKLPGLLRLTNCVIGLNEVVPAFYNGFLGVDVRGFATGAGIYCSNAVVEYSTIASNRLQIEPILDSAQRLGSNIAGISAPGGAISLHAVILSNDGTNAFGTFIDRGYSLISDNSISVTQATSRQNVDVRLDSFSIPDGVHGYFVPLPDSPAIDGGDPANFPATDVRGIRRPYGSGPDIGAVEATPNPGITVAKERDQIVLSFSRVFAGSVTVESSNDLSTWSPVLTSLTGESTRIAVPEELRVQFYRIRENAP